MNDNVTYYEYTMKGIITYYDNYLNDKMTLMDESSDSLSSKDNIKYNE